MSRTKPANPVDDGELIAALAVTPQFDLLFWDNNVYPSFEAAVVHDAVSRIQAKGAEKLDVALDAVRKTARALRSDKLYLRVNVTVGRQHNVIATFDYPPQLVAKPSIPTSDHLEVIQPVFWEDSQSVVAFDDCRILDRGTTVTLGLVKLATPRKITQSHTGWVQHSIGQIPVLQLTFVDSSRQVILGFPQFSGHSIMLQGHKNKDINVLFTHPK